jgi:hypothetical protein
MRLRLLRVVCLLLLTLASSALPVAHARMPAHVAAHAPVEQTDRAAVAIGNTAEQSGKTWKWTVFVMGADSALDDIQCVEYLLHPTFPDPLRKVCARGSEKELGFSLPAEGWGTFLIHARVIRKRGGEIQLTHELRFDVQGAGWLVLGPRAGKDTARIHIGAPNAPTWGFTLNLRIERTQNGECTIRFDNLERIGTASPFENWTFDVLANDREVMSLAWRPRVPTPPGQRTAERKLTLPPDEPLELRVLARRSHR